MGTKRSESQAETRRRLIEAARELLAVRAVDDVTLDDVATHAGYTKGAVYSNFDSKADVLLAVLDQRITEGAVDYVDIVSSGSIFDIASDAGQRAERTQRTDLDYFRLHVALWAEAIEDQKIAEGYAALRRRQRDRLAAAITERAAAEGLDLGDEAEHLAAGLIGMSYTSMLEALIDPDVDVNAIHRTMVQTVIAGLLGRLRS